MSSYLKASVISLILFMSHNSVSAQDKQNPFSKRYDNCEEAYQDAAHDIAKDSILYFAEKVRFDWHKGYSRLLPSTALNIKKADQFDSLMLALHNIRVIRHMNYGSYDNTMACYNKAIEHHMDSTYGHFFHIRILNMVEELNGEPPLVSEEELEAIVRSKKKGN